MINIITLYDFLIIAGAIQGFFLSIIIFSIKTGNKKANLFLCFLLLSYSLSIVNTEIFNIFHSLLTSASTIGDPLQFLFGPFFYFYIRYLTDLSFKFSLKNICHFIPSILFFLICANKNFMDFISKDLKLFSIIIWFLIIIQMMIYLLFISVKLVKYRKNIKNEFSNIDKINLNWIWFIIRCLIIFYSLYILLIPVLLHFIEPYNHFNKVVMIMMSLLIYGIGYKGLIQPNIFTRPDNKSESNNRKYVKSTLDENKISSDFEKLKKLMEEKKLYKNIDLNLSDLADELNISNHNLSQTINLKTGENFYDFINSYRVEEVKKLLSDNESLKKFTILSLAYEAGFNSKATFNKFFKKSTGLTPTEFIKNL